MDYIINYKKWNALFEQDEQGTKVEKLDKKAGENLRTNNTIDKRLDYIKSADGDVPGKKEFEDYKNRMWVMVYSQLIVHGVELSAATKGGTDKNYVNYMLKSDEGTYYPFYGNFSNLKVPADWIKQSSDLFNQRYWAAFDKKVSDRTWINYYVTQLNDLFGSSVDKPSDTVKSIQAYIKNQIKDKSFVLNNGTKGRDFVDGVWGPVSATAWLKFSKSISPSRTLASIMVTQGVSKSKNVSTPEVPIDSSTKSSMTAPAKTAVNTKPATSTGGPNPSTFGKANTL